MIPERGRLLQIARLIGIDAFSERFGTPQTAAPKAADLRALVDSHLDAIARALVEEAAASDDVTDQAGAQSFLEDRLRTLGDLLSTEQAERVRRSFVEKISNW